MLCLYVVLEDGRRVGNTHRASWHALKATVWTDKRGFPEIFGRNGLLGKPWSISHECNNRRAAEGVGKCYPDVAGGIMKNEHCVVASKV